MLDFDKLIRFKFHYDKVALEMRCMCVWMSLGDFGSCIVRNWSYMVRIEWSPNVRLTIMFTLRKAGFIGILVIIMLTPARFNAYSVFNWHVLYIALFCLPFQTNERKTHKTFHLYNPNYGGHYGNSNDKLIWKLRKCRKNTILFCLFFVVCIHSSNLSKRPLNFSLL